MRRRDFLFAVGNAAVAWPLGVRAQQVGDVRRVAVLMGVAKSPIWIATTASLFHRLGELGWREGRNLVTQVQWNQPGLMRVRATELMARSPDVAVVFTNYALKVLKPIAGKVPIVFVGIGDPVGSGFVTSLAQPGGNITGFASHELTMGGKWLEVLKETAPHITRALVIFRPETPGHQGMWQSAEKAARRLGIEVTAGEVRNTADIKRVFASFAQKPNGGLVMIPGALAAANSLVLIALAQRYRLPLIFASAEHVANGGLVSYGLDWNDQFRRAAEYVDRIFRGTKPSDLPVQKPTRFKLVVNLKTAKAIGLTVPATLLARAATDQHAEPPTTARNSRRLIPPPRLRSRQSTGLLGVAKGAETGFDCWSARCSQCLCWVISGHCSAQERCPLYPRQRTFGGAMAILFCADRDRSVPSLLTLAL